MKKVSEYGIGTKALSMLLSILITFSVIGVGVVPLMDTIASAAGDVITVNQPSLVYFNVPEAIYLKPGAKTFEYVCDQKMTIDTANKTASISVDSNYPSKAISSGGNINFYCETAKNISIDIDNYSKNTLGVEVTVGTKTATDKLINTTITGGKVGSSTSSTQITWIATYTDTKDNQTKTAVATTYVYDPFTSPVGAAAFSRYEYKNKSNTKAGLISWWQGIHNFESNSYVKDGSSKSATTKEENSSYYFSPMVDGIKTSTATDLQPTNWIKDSSSTFQKSIYYRESLQSGISDERLTVATTGYTALLYADSSRFTNLNQIPNVKAGTYLTAVYGSKYTHRNEYVISYTSSWDTGVKLSDNFRNTLKDKFNSGTAISVIQPQTGASIGNKYNNISSYSWTTSDTSKEFAYSAIEDMAAKSSGGLYKVWATAVTFCPIKITINNKSSLRTAANEARKYFGRFGVTGYDTDGKLKSNIFTTSDSDWVNFRNAYYEIVSNLVYVPGGVSASATTYAGNMTTYINNLSNKSGTATAKYYVTKNGTTTEIADSYLSDSIKNSRSKTYKYGDCVKATADTITGFTFANTIEVYKGTTKIQTVTGNVATVNYANSSELTFKFYYTPESKTLTINSNNGKNTGNLLYLSGGASIFSGGSTTNIDFTSSYEADGDLTVSGKRYLDIAEGKELTTPSNVCYVYLEEGKTYIISFKSSNANTDFFMFGPNGGHCNANSSAEISRRLDSSTGLYITQKEFTVGVAKGDSSWAKEEFKGKLTGVYSIRLDQDGFATGNFAKGNYSVTDLKLVETECDADDDNKVLHYPDDSVVIPDPVRTGYTFDGWTYSPSTPAGVAASGGKTTFTMPASDLKITAKWKANTFWIKFVGNGKTTGEMADQSFVYDQTSNNTLRDRTYRKIYTVNYSYANGGSGKTSDTSEASFLGWSWNGKTYSNLANVKNLVTYATTQANALQFTATWGAMPSITLPLPTKTGYAFKEWNTKQDGTGTRYLAGNSYTPSAESVTLYAIWNANAYTVTLNNNGADKVAGTSSVSPTYDSNMPTPITLPQKTGYTFAGYYYNNTQYYTSAGESARTWNVAAATTLTASWTPNSYTVSFNGNGSSSGSMSNQSRKFDDGKPLTANAFSRVYSVSLNYNGATDKKGGLDSYTSTYGFGGWSKTPTGAKQFDNSSTANIITDKETSQTLYAVWTGGAITLPTPERTGYTFTGWYTALEGGVRVDSDTSKRYYAKSAGVTLYAHWTANGYKITLSPEFTADQGSSLGTTEPFNATYDLSMPAKTMPSRIGWTFGGYYTEKNGGGTQYYKADGTSARNWDRTAATTLYAKWTVNSYSVTVDPNGGTYNSTTDKTTTTGHNFASEVTIANPSRTGYTFTGWEGYTKSYPNGDCAVTSYTKSSVTAATNYKITATTAATEGITFAGPYDVLTGDTVTIKGQIYVHSTQVEIRVYNGLRSNDFNNKTNIGTETGKWVPFTVTRTVTEADKNRNAVGYMQIYSGSIEGLTGTISDFDLKDIEITVTHKNQYPTKFYMPAHNVNLKATWREHNYKVVFNPNGGTGTMSDEAFRYTQEKALTANAFTKTGYHFIGWAESADGPVKYTDGKAVSKLTPTDNGTVNLYAKWEANKYKFQFDANGGSGTMTEQEFTYDAEETAIKANTFTNNFNVTYNYNYTGAPANKDVPFGYEMIGWSKTKGGAKAYNDGDKVRNVTTTNNDSITLYAIWELTPYELETPSRAGYTFAGWYTTNDWNLVEADEYEQTVKAVWEDLVKQGKKTGAMPADFVIPDDFVIPNSQYYVGMGGDSVSFTSAVTLYAKWTDSQGPQIASTSVTNNYANSQTVTINLTENEGVKGYYWGTKSDYQYNTFTAISGNPKESTVTITVNADGTYYFTAIDNNSLVSETKSFTFYRTTLEKVGGSVPSGKNGPILTLSGNQIDMPVATKAGYTFDGWYTASSNGVKKSNGNDKYSPVASASLYAVWTPKIVVFDENYKDASGKNVTVNYFAPKTADFSNKHGLTTVSFERGTDIVTLDGTLESGMDVLVSEFRPEAGATYKFTFDIVDGSFSGDGCLVLEQYDIGGSNVNGARKNFDLRAGSATSKNFTHNAKDANSIVKIKFWLWKNKNLTFNNLKVRIKVEKVTDASQTFTYTVGAKHLTEATYGTLPTPVRKGYTFNGWYTAASGGTKVESTTSCASLTGTTTLYARWTANTYTVTYHNDNTACNYPHKDGSVTTSTFTYDVKGALNKNTFRSWYVVSYVPGSGASTVSPTNAYAKFLGWTTKNGSKVVEYEDEESIEENIAESGNIDLYAIWDNGEAELGTPLKSGFTLQGWFTEQTGGIKVGGAGDKYTPTADITLYAIWTAVEIKNKTVVYDFQKGITVSAIDEKDTVPSNLYEASLVIGKIRDASLLGLATSSTNIEGFSSDATFTAQMVNPVKGNTQKSDFTDFTSDSLKNKTKISFDPSQATEETIYFELQFKSSQNGSTQYITGSITFVPANSVYFEETAFSKADSINGTEDYDSGKIWLTTVDSDFNTEAGTEYQAYGYSNSYNNKTSFSGGTMTLSELTSTERTSNIREFKFEGNGFELISDCGPKTGALMVYIWKQNGSGYKLIANSLVDTYLSDENVLGSSPQFIYDSRTLDVGKLLRQVPVYHFMTAERGTYLVQVQGVYVEDIQMQGCALTEESGIQMLANELEESGIEVDENLLEVKFMDENSVLNLENRAESEEVSAIGLLNSISVEDILLGASDDYTYTFIDGIRIYKPTENESKYYSWERNAKFFNIRQCLRTNDYTEYTTTGTRTNDPSNEIYLAPKSTEVTSGTAFSVSGFEGSEKYRVMVSLRAAKGTTKVYISGGVGSTNKISLNLNHSTEMYYDITDVVGSNGIVVITNEGSGYAAVCNIKITTTDGTVPNIKVNAIEESMQGSILQSFTMMEELNNLEYVPLVEPEKEEPDVPDVPDEPVVKNPTIVISKAKSEYSVDYRTQVNFYAKVENMPEGGKIAWYNGSQCVGYGDTYTIEEATSRAEITAKVVRADGSIAVETDSVAINVKGGFIQKLIAFFKKLLKKLPKLNIGKY